MKLENYINDLLYRYDCVIVPNFGGFIANKVSATLDESTQTLNPPTKQIGFNANLKHNDGLLANYIASLNDISFDKANAFIDKEVMQWLTTLEQEKITIASIGTIVFNEEKQLLFEPNDTINFLTESFGLSSVSVGVKERYEEKVIPLHTASALEEEINKGVSTFTKIAAAAAILLTFSFAYQQYANIQEKNTLAKQQEVVEKKIQEATFVIDNPLPTINLSVSKPIAKEYHVVAGAFELYKNATKKVNQLKDQGYEAFILGENKWGLTQVAFNSYETREEAAKVLEEVKRVGYEDAWLLVKKIE